MLFGGAVYDLTVTSARCGLSYATPAANYTCDEMWPTIAKTIMMPDQNIGKGTIGVMAMRELPDETIEQFGVVRDVQEQSFRTQIIIGIVGLGFLSIFLSWFFIKVSPASGIDLGSLSVSILCAFLTISVIMVMFDESAEPGFLGIENARVPFKGLRTLLAHPDVMATVIDDTALLPGTLTTDDILEGES